MSLGGAWITFDKTVLGSKFIPAVNIELEAGSSVSDQNNMRQKICKWPIIVLLEVVLCSSGQKSASPRG